MSEKKQLNEEQLEKANGGYSPPEYDDYDDCPQYKKPNNKNVDNDNSKRDLDRMVNNYPAASNDKSGQDKK